MSAIGVVGWGVVGQAVGKGFASKKENQIYWYDKYKKSPHTLPQLIDRSKFIFVCVPTPMFSDGSGIDLSTIDGVVKDLAHATSGTDKILIIKSTVIPGICAGYSRKYPKVNVVMNPEFLTEVNAPWDFLHPARVVIGAISEDVAGQVARLYRSLLGYEVKIFTTDPTTAEMVKYMANTFMATKIIFANEIASLSKKLGINYTDVKKMVAADPRINEEFLNITPFGGFGLKCFPKDTVALLGLARKLKIDLSLIRAAWLKNLQIRKVRDWEKIDGAVRNKKSGRK